MSQDREKLIAEAVEKALAGDIDTINAIEDRVTRSKAKAALAKAKRGQGAKAPVEEPSAKEEILQNTNQKVGSKIAEKFPDAMIGEPAETHIQLRAKDWEKVASWLKSEDDLFFDSLQCITGIDVGEDVLESRYNFHSMKHKHAIEVRIAVPVKKANIPSIEQLWRIGDWFERETYDMVGITFEGHRDLRRMLLPEDWEGYPLRKDYDVQETYHGIAVPKQNEGWE